MLQQENKAKKTQETNTASLSSSQCLEGLMTLSINPEASYNKISDLKRFLSAEPNIKIISTGAVVGKGPWIRLFINKPVPLFEVLHAIPVVQQVTGKGRQIHIVIP